MSHAFIRKGNIMKIEIYGTGCAKCTTLYENTCQAVAALGIDAEITKVTDINQITSAGVMLTPAISVNGEIKSSGKVLTPDDIIAFLE